MFLKSVQVRLFIGSDSLYCDVQAAILRIDLTQARPSRALALKGPTHKFFVYKPTRAQLPSWIKGSAGSAANQFAGLVEYD